MLQDLELNYKLPKVSDETLFYLNTWLTDLIHFFYNLKSGIENKRKYCKTMCIVRMMTEGETVNSEIISRFLFMQIIGLGEYRKNKNSHSDILYIHIY